MGGLTRKKKQETRQSAFLKVVHPRGYVEVFREPITAGEIMRRYARHCITRTDFFEYPWIVVRPESVLVPGKVFLLVPHSTVDRVMKEKRQQLQAENLRQDQSARQRNHGQNHNRQNSALKSLEERYYRRQTSDHRRPCNNVDDDRQGQDSGSRSQYKPSFYEFWRKMQRSLNQPHQESYVHLDLEHDSPFNNGRPHVTSPEQVELQRVKSCLRKPDSGRKRLNLKVSFASPVVIPGSRSGSPSIQQNDLVLQF